MKLNYKVSTDSSNQSILTLSGYIAQLATSPLTSTMDKFLEKLAVHLKTTANYDFNYTKVTSFLPKFKMSIPTREKQFFLIGIALIFLTSIAGYLFGHATEALLSALFILGGYYVGRKYLRK